MLLLIKNYPFLKAIAEKDFAKIKWGFGLSTEIAQKIDWNVFKCFAPSINLRQRAIENYELLKVHITHLEESRGLWLLPNKVGMFYEFKDSTAIIFIMGGLKLLGRCHIMGINKDGSIKVGGESAPGVKVNWTGVASELFCVKAFLQFTEPSTRISEKIQSNSKLKINNVKFKSDLPIDVTYLDTSYLEGIKVLFDFSVRGHYAIYHVGKGRKDERLVYKKPHVRHGYTRRPKKELHKIKI